MTKKVSIIIPCFNEQEVISTTHSEINSILKNNTDLNFELIYIDDGSQDRTAEILRDICMHNSRVKFIRLSRNFGHQAALTAGIDHAFGDAIAILDADLQDPPSVILEMLNWWRQGFEVVYGVRLKRKEPLFKRACYKIFYYIWRRIANIEVPIDSGDFCVMDQKVAKCIREMPENGRFLRGLRAWAGFRQMGHLYERSARHAGDSKYTMLRLIQLAANGIFNFSELPLRLISIAGIILSVFSLFGGFLVLIQRIFEIRIFGYAPQDVPGYTTILLSLQLFSGIQLFCLGLIGEYIARMYNEIKRRPVYIIAEQHGF